MEGHSFDWGHGNEVDSLHHLCPKPREYCLALPPGFSFPICIVARGWPESQVKMRHKWRQFNDLAIKIVVHRQPCGDILSQKL